jgi:hypothetical protein
LCRPGYIRAIDFDEKRERGCEKRRFRQKNPYAVRLPKVQKRASERHLGVMIVAILCIV